MTFRDGLAELAKSWRGLLGFWVAEMAKSWKGLLGFCVAEMAKSWKGLLFGLYDFISVIFLQEYGETGELRITGDNEVLAIQVSLL